MLSGNNSILQKATDAKSETEKGQEKEFVVLAYNSALAKKVSNNDLTPVTAADLNTELTSQGASADGSNPIIVTFSVSKRQYTVNNGVVDYAGIKNGDEQNDNDLPTALGTKPYFPSDKFKQLGDTDLTNGLVITDKTENEEYGNEYVWIEVPSTAVDSTATGGPDYTGVSGSTDYENIATALRTYCTKDARGEDLITIGTSSSDSFNTTTRGNIDRWYDGSGLIASESSNTSDVTGCGLTSSQYTELYNKMLKSVYENGGFWIGRYEAGTAVAREATTDSIEGLTPLSKLNSYPINYVTCSQAQTIAGSVPNKGIYNSSLMFGIQWDLVLRHLSNKGVETSLLISDSSTWGNYYNQPFGINRGKYSQASPWNVYIDYTKATENKVQVEGGVSTKIGTTSANKILLTTGASDNNSKKNIYDLAGNVYEYTLEEASGSGYACTLRGGSFDSDYSINPASNRIRYLTSRSYYNDGFRVALY